MEAKSGKTRHIDDDIIYKILDDNYNVNILTLELLYHTNRSLLESELRKSNILLLTHALDKVIFDCRKNNSKLFHLALMLYDICEERIKEFSGPNYSDYSDKLITRKKLINEHIGL